jgi:hypothetical protein
MAGLDYVSCSPYRVPIARVAAAQAAGLPEQDLPVQVTSSTSPAAPSPHRV